MAKKGQQIALQTEANNDEEWEALLQKPGLLVVDVFTEWSGPCSTMVGNLKKIKMELGSDFLNYGLAKSDGITSLSRFKGKCEPTWLFIANGKIVNVLFGANSPKLMQMIADELKMENALRESEGTRAITYEIDVMCPEEEERLAVQQAVFLEELRQEQEELRKRDYERRMAICNVVMENYPDTGFIMVFSHAKKAAMLLFEEMWTSAGIEVQIKDKVRMNQEHIDDLMYFTSPEFQLSESDIEALVNYRTLLYAVKFIDPNSEENIDETVLNFVYGESKQPPGAPESPADKLVRRPVVAQEDLEQRVSRLSEMAGLSNVALDKLEEVAAAAEVEPEEEKPPEPDIPGVWAPPNNLARSTAIKLFFKKLYEPIALPEPKEIPPCVIVAFEGYKRRDVCEMIEQYPEDVIRYGYFTSDDVANTTFITKLTKKWEKRMITGEAETDKLVIQLSRKTSEPLSAFANLGPTFMSHDADDGKRQVKVFFPEGYDDIVEEDPDAKKKKGKRKGKKGEAEEVEAEAEPEAEPEGGDQDAATSPMPDEEAEEPPPPEDA